MFKNILNVFLFFVAMMVTTVSASAEWLHHLAIRSETKIFNTVVRMDSKVKFTKKDFGKQDWDVFGVTFADCNKKVLRFERIGDGGVISESQLVVDLEKRNPEEEKRIFDLFPLPLPEEEKRVAFLFVAKPADFSKKKITLNDGEKLLSELTPLLKKRSAFLAYPISLGFKASASLTPTVCTCKAFFGCTTGCCSSANCEVRLGFCQSNSNCVKVDRTSSCACG